MFRGLDIFLLFFPIFAFFGLSSLSDVSSQLFFFFLLCSKSVYMTCSIHALGLHTTSFHSLQFFLLTSEIFSSLLIEIWILFFFWSSEFITLFLSLGERAKDFKAQSKHQG